MFEERFSGKEVDVVWNISVSRKGRSRVIIGKRKGVSGGKGCEGWMGLKGVEVGFIGSGFQSAGFGRDWHTVDDVSLPSIVCTLSSPIVLVPRRRNRAAMQLWWLDTMMDRARQQKKKKKRAPRGRHQVQKAIRDKKEDALQAAVELTLRSAMGGDLSKARDGFEKMRPLEAWPSLSTYNLILRSFEKLSGSIDVEKVFAEMKQRDVTPNLVSYAILLRAYGRVGDSTGVRRSFSRLLDHSLEPTAKIYAAAVNFCAEAGDIDGVDWIIDVMRTKKPEPSEPIYVALIKHSALHDDIDEVERLFHDMIDRGFSPTVDIFTSRIFVHGRNGRIATAENILQEMISSDLEPKEPTYTALIRAYLAVEDFATAETTFQRMKAANLIPTPATLAIMISAYRRTGDVERAEELLTDAKNHNVKIHRKTYHTLMQIQSKNTTISRAFDTFKMFLVDEHSPTVATYASIFSPFVTTTKSSTPSSFSSTKRRKKSRTIVKFATPDEIVSSLVPVELQYSALLDAFLKSSEISAAHRLVSFMEKNNVRIGIDTFNGLAEYFMKRKETELAVEVLERVETAGIDLDVRSFRELIRAQSEEGNVEGTLQTVKWMRRYEIVPVRGMYRAAIEAFNRDEAFAVVVDALDVSRRRVKEMEEARIDAEEKRKRKLLLELQEEEEDEEDEEEDENENEDDDEDDEEEEHSNADDVESYASEWNNDFDELILEQDNEEDEDDDEDDDDFIGLNDDDETDDLLGLNDDDDDDDDHPTSSTSSVDMYSLLLSVLPSVDNDQRKTMNET